jgi:hypothetical protein
MPCVSPTDMSTKKLEELEKRKSSEEQIAKLRAERVKLAQKVLKPIQDFSVGVLNHHRAWTALKLQAAGKESVDTMDELIVNGFGQLQAQINCSAISEKVDQGDIEIEEVDREIHDGASRILVIAAQNFPLSILQRQCAHADF